MRNLERELGVDIFERDRSGATLSGTGRELLAHVPGVIDAVDGLRHAADAQHQASRMVRVATVNAGTVPVLTPAIKQFRAANVTTQVEVVGAQEDEIHRGLRAGSFDLGLVTTLRGDDVRPEFDSQALMIGLLRIGAPRQLDNRERAIGLGYRRPSVTTVAAGSLPGTRSVLERPLVVTSLVRSGRGGDATGNTRYQPPLPRGLHRPADLDQSIACVVRSAGNRSRATGPNVPAI